MFFTSFEFIALIAVLFGMYYLVPGKHQWKLLLIFNGIFVASAGVRAWGVLLIMLISNYILAIVMEKQNKKTAGHMLYVCLLLDIGIIAGFKIITGNMPFGLSYYGIMLIGYVIEVKRRTYKAERNIFKLAVFTGFFPAMVQGPISKYADVKESLFKVHHFDYKRTVFALERILYGYFKKMVVADRMAPIVNDIISNTGYSGTYVFAGILFYAVQLYADFTGGIDITVGIAEFLGIELKENFINPFTSKNLAEYWRRWHISLGEWIKEYVFYPVSVSKPLRKISKKMRQKNQSIGRKIPVYIASMIAWFATGFWHGSQLHFILWGMANCLIILISQELKPVYRKFHERFPVFTENKRVAEIYNNFQAIRTFLLVCILRMSDCYQDVGVTTQMFVKLITDFRITEVGWVFTLAEQADYVILGLGIFLMYLVGKKKKNADVREYLYACPAVVKYGVILGMFFSIVVFGAYGIGYDATQFIYNNV